MTSVISQFNTLKCFRGRCTKPSQLNHCAGGNTKPNQTCIWWSGLIAGGNTSYLGSRLNLGRYHCMPPWEPVLEECIHRYRFAGQIPQGFPNSWYFQTSEDEQYTHRYWLALRVAEETVRWTQSRFGCNGSSTLCHFRRKLKVQWSNADGTILILTTVLSNLYFLLPFPRVPIQTSEFISHATSVAQGLPNNS